MKCEACGAERDPGDRFCRNCGLRLPKAETAANSPVATEQAVKPVRRRGCSALLMAASVSIVVLALLANLLAQIAPDILKFAGFKPKDLGVKWSAADFASIVQKCGVLADTPPQGSDKSAYDFEFSGTKDVDWTLTDSEITAWMNTDRPGWWPFSDVQFRCHASNLLEVSFTLNPAKLMQDKDVTACLPQDMQGYLSSVSVSVPVYATAKVTFTGPKQAEVQVISCESMGISLMAYAQSEQIDKILTDIVNMGLAKAAPVKVESFTTSEGSLNLTGEWYTEMKRVPAAQP